MNVVTIPTNVPVQRVDEEDGDSCRIPADKFQAISQEDQSTMPILASQCWSAPSRSRSRSSLSDFLVKEGEARGAERPPA